MNLNSNPDTSHLQDYLQNLKQPTTLLEIKNKFPDISECNLLVLIKKLESNNEMLNRIHLFFSGKVKLFFPKESCVKQIYVKYNFKKKQPTFNFDELILKESKTEEEISFLLQKLKEKESQLEKIKTSFTSKDERIKKTHQYNDIKDMCGVVFQRLAEIEGKMIQEVYDEFGIERK